MAPDAPASGGGDGGVLLHPRVGGGGYLDLGCWPFQIPLGALIPVRVDNLRPAARTWA